MKKSSVFELKFAYILFLMVCAIYHIVAGIFNLEFEAWERIVCAATIASYFFSIASAKKSMCTLASKINGAIKSSRKNYIEIKSEMMANPDKHVDSALSVDDLEKIIAEDDEVTKKFDKECCKQQKWAFVLNATGFLVFFLILTFRGIYGLFDTSQDFFTLLAFVLILFVDTFEEFWMNKYGWIIQQKATKKENDGCIS